MDSHALHVEIGAGWNLLAADKYRAELEDHVESLRTGGHSLLPPEEQLLGNHLPSCYRAIHLQCSHGFAALGLLNLGVTEIVGIDISEEMISQAREKTRRLGARAYWHCCDVLAAPNELDGTADLVYTGRGALPWVMDLAEWARVVRRLVRMGGRVFVFEGHPLDAAWEREAQDYRIRAGYDGYFSDAPREQPGFPASAVSRAAGEGSRPVMWERPWRPGQVIGALSAAGFRLEHFDEYSTLYWNQFPNMHQKRRALMPHTYAILAVAHESPRH